MEPILHSEEHAGYTINVYQDEPEFANPREWENLAVLECWHPDYILGDRQFTHADYPEAESMADVGAAIKARENVAAILPLYLYDHSGISISTGNWADTIDPGGWDTSAVGFAYITWGKVREAGVSRDIRRLEEMIRSEVSEYDSYLRGDVCRWTVEDGAGDVLEGCGGYLGPDLYDSDDYMMSEARAAAERCRDEAKAEALERAELEARDIVTVSA